MASSFTLESILQSISLPTAFFTSPATAVLTPVAAGALIGYSTRPAKTQNLYNALRQPPGYPPAWLFGPVWTMLYGAMGYASYRATVSGLSSPSPSVRDLTRTSQGMYTLQLGANLVWMPLFFVFRKPATALADIVLLSGMVLGLTNNYRKLDGMAAWLLAPYSAWLGYATYLNFMTGHLNEWDISDEKVASSRKGAVS